MDFKDLEELATIIGSDKVEHLLKYVEPDQIMKALASVDIDAIARGDVDFDLDDDHKMFTPYLGDTAFIQPYQLYGKFGEELKADPNFQEATIYFIAKRKKLRFVLSDTRFEGNDLIFSISIEGKRTITNRMSLPLLLTGEERHDLKEIFMKPISSFFELQVLQQKMPHYPLSGIMINKTKSNENTLFFNIYASDGRSVEKYVMPHLLLNGLGIDANDFSEVLYIGQSCKMGDRVISHEKIQRALAEKNDTEDIYLYFFNIKEKTIFHGAEDSWKRVGITFLVGSSETPSDNVVEITDEGRINLVEMALINYFKPEYNTTFVDTKIPLNQQVKNLLKTNGYTRIMAEVNFDSVFYRFSSGYVRPKQHHAIVYKLNE